MSKHQIAKLLMTGAAYLATGVVLILGTLVMLGPLMEGLANFWADEAMPGFVSLTPLLVTFVGVGWGGYFMWKGMMGPAPVILLYLIGKAGYKILGLHRITIRRRRGIAVLVMLISIAIVFVELIPAGFKLFSDSTIISVSHPVIVLIGIIALIVSIAVGTYRPDESIVATKGRGNE